MEEKRPVLQISVVGTTQGGHYRFVRIEGVATVGGSVQSDSLSE